MNHGVGVSISEKPRINQATVEYLTVKNQALLNSTTFEFQIIFSVKIYFEYK